MNRFVLVFLAISMTSIGATAINFLWIGAASADGNGKLIFVEVVIDGVGGVDGLDDAMSVTVSPDGKHLYVASTVDRSVAVFSRNSTTGVLTFVEAHKDGVGGVDGLGGAMSVTVSPDGNHVYVTGEYQDEMAVFSRNSTTGELTFVEVYKEGVGGVVGFDGVRSVMVSPDGKHLYTASHFDDALAVFSRNATSGKLTSVEIHKDGVGGVDGLDAARSVTVSPDGKHVYAAGEFENEVAVFSRDSTTGKLTFVEVVRDGVGGVDGLSSAYSIAISPGGTHVYVAGRYENAVAVFNRDSTIGKLTFVEVNKDGVGGVDGLDSIRSVTVSPDGYHIYAAGGYDDAIAVFNRDSTTGRLTFVETQNDSVGGVDGLNAAQSVTVSPDAKHIYVAGPHDNAVAVFSHNATTGSADLEVVKTGSPDPVAAGANLTYVITV
ncbi:MAG: beta-propeller fold lactonase family protein, partial [SAR202 cluster bacterium]|nr:beta-propeller fold lactonase family protein [SAR202 cluster bacterium]